MDILSVMIFLMIVFCALDRVHLSDSLEREKVYFSTKLQHTDDRNDGFYPFEYIVKVSIKQCVDACTFTKACEYINYDVPAHTCALIRRKSNVHDSAVVINKSGYVFGNKSEWSMNKVSKCDECFDYGPCESDSLCRNSGCKLKAESSGVFNGNMLTTGAKIEGRVKADHHISSQRSMESLRCSYYGMWLIDHCVIDKYNESTYYIQTAPMSWFDAKAYCESLSGHLADINTSDEQKVITSALIGSYRISTWIGGNDIEVEGTFLWSDGSDMSGYNNWGPLLNEDKDVEDCTSIQVDTSDNFYWNDLGCDKNLQSVCEFQYI